MSALNARWGRRGRVRASIVALTLLASGALTVIPAPAAAAAAAPHARASLTQIESDVMCVVCHESLAVAQSPEAFQERQVIRTLIAQGEGRTEIEHQLVEQYGPAVLALPPAHGFNLLIYVIPPVLLILGIATVMITLPKWRRRSRAAAAEPLPSAGDLNPADATRLDEDLARHA